MVSRFLLLIALIIWGCSKTPQNNITPKWIYLSPSQNGTIGGVGMSGKHIDGKTGQRELAISRALDEIAKQLGTKVTTIQKIDMNGNSSSINSNIETYSFQTAEGKVVKSAIESIWYDEKNDEIYILMVVRGFATN